MTSTHPARRARVRAAAAPRERPALGRVLDLLVAVAALLFFAPLILVVAMVVMGERSGPVLFAHPRIGRDGRRFHVLKFRSMCVDADRRLAEHLAADPAAAREWATDHKLKRDPRITPVGRFLRASSLDELPQILNVLRGDMSIVGPRPIVEAEVAKYGRFFPTYCSVRPGITGVWQVSGRNDVSYRRRVAMDVAYARRKSVALDVRLMLATVPAVLARRGSY